MNGKQRVAASRGEQPDGWLQTGAAAIEFRRASPSRNGRSRPTDREPGECQLKLLDSSGGPAAVGNLERIATLLFGVGFVSALVILAIVFPSPSPFQYTIFRITLALAAAGIGAFVPGLLHAEIRGIRAGGALVIFIVVYYFSPASLVAERPSFNIDNIKAVRRAPVFDLSFSDTDEVVASVHGRLEISRSDASQSTVVAFWRVANAFETNWHACRRRIGGNYVLAELEGDSAIAGQWDFQIGGIEINRSYSGPVSVVLIALNRKMISLNAEKWIRGDLGWGVERLPGGEGRLAISAPVSFETTPIR
jgi:hypothetical protein